MWEYQVTEVELEAWRSYILEFIKRAGWIKGACKRKEVAKVKVWLPRFFVELLKRKAASFTLYQTEMREETFLVTLSALSRTLLGTRFTVHTFENIYFLEDRDEEGAPVVMKMKEILMQCETLKELGETIRYYCERAGWVDRRRKKFKNWDYSDCWLDFKLVPFFFYTVPEFDKKLTFLSRKLRISRGELFFFIALCRLSIKELEEILRKKFKVKIPEGEPILKVPDWVKYPTADSYRSFYEEVRGVYLGDADDDKGVLVRNLRKNIDFGIIGALQEEKENKLQNTNDCAIISNGEKGKEDTLMQSENQLSLLNQQEDKKEEISEKPKRKRPPKPVIVRGFPPPKLPPKRDPNNPHRVFVRSDYGEWALYKIHPLLKEWEDYKYKWEMVVVVPRGEGEFEFYTLEWGKDVAERNRKLREEGKIQFADYLTNVLFKVWKNSSKFGFWHEGLWEKYGDKCPYCGERFFRGVTLPVNLRFCKYCGLVFSILEVVKFEDEYDDEEEEGSKPVKVEDSGVSEPCCDESAPQGEITFADIQDTYSYTKMWKKVYGEEQDEDFQRLVDEACYYSTEPTDSEVEAFCKAIEDTGVDFLTDMIIGDVRPYDYTTLFKLVKNLLKKAKITEEQILSKLYPDMLSDYLVQWHAKSGDIDVVVSQFLPILLRKTVMARPDGEKFLRDNPKLLLTALGVPLGLQKCYHRQFEDKLVVELVRRAPNYIPYDLYHFHMSPDKKDNPSSYILGVVERSTNKLKVIVAKIFVPCIALLGDKRHPRETVYIIKPPERMDLEFLPSWVKVITFEEFVDKVLEIAREAFVADKEKPTGG